MKRIFLINFSSPILITVADNLKKSGMEIAYWQGYRDDFDGLDKSLYPGTIFHHAFDAIKNIPPTGIDVLEFEPLSQELISQLYASGWQALSMMGRADSSNSVFTKKRNYYYQYLKFWQGMIKKYRPQVIVFSAVPHSACNYTLYTLAKLANIQTIMINQLTVGSRALLMTDYQIDSEFLKNEVQKTKGINDKVEDLSRDLRNYYLNQLNSKIDSTPEYKKDNMKSKAPFQMPSLPIIIKHLYGLTFFKTARFYLEMFFTKRSMNYIDGSLYGWQYKLKVRQWQKLINQIKKEYEALQQTPDLSIKFIYLPLSFQPEQTTCPRGDVFDDQMLMIDIISSALPEGWKLYIKEHIPQWYPKSIEGYQYRYRGYYQQIMSYKNTVLVPADTSTFDLIECAQAVATVTGTAGWEALMRSKPVLLFGYIWYMYCAGVFRVNSLYTCQQAITQIKDGYQVPPQEIVNFLAALDKVSLKVKNYKTRTFVESDGITFAGNVQALTDGIINMINKP